MKSSTLEFRRGGPKECLCLSYKLETFGEISFVHDTMIQKNMGTETTTQLKSFDGIEIYGQ